MERDSRIRVALVGFLTLGVMGGVVIAALRRHASSDPDTLAAGAPARPPGRGDGTDLRDLPPECEPDEANPSKVVFDLPDGRTLDLGSVKQGVTIERDVVVRNAGTGPLCIPVDPQTGCGCVKATWVGASQVPPGATGIVHLKIDTRDKEGRTDKEVIVHSNEPGRRQAVFRVTFLVNVGIVVAHTTNVTGPVVYFGRHAPGKPGTAVVRLKSPRDGPAWVVKEVDGGALALTYTAADVEPNDPLFRHVDVTITHPGATLLDKESRPFTIRTTHPDRPEIPLHAALTVKARYYAAPTSLRFGFVGGTSVPTPRLATIAAGEEGASFVVTGAEVVGPGFTAGPPTDRGREGWTIEVRYDQAARAKGPVDATLVVRVSDPEAPTVEIPIHADARE